MGGGASDDAGAEEAPAKKPMEPKPREEERLIEVKRIETKSKPRLQCQGVEAQCPKHRGVTFKVGDAPAATGPNWVAMGGGFDVGLLFGLALWYLGVLSALDIEPLGLF